MSRFTLAIHTDNAAFRDPFELVRIIEHVARAVEHDPSMLGGQCRDINGNAVGQWKNEPRDSDED